MTTQTLQPASLTVDPSAVRAIAISGKSGLVGSALARSLSLAEKKILNVTRGTNTRSINDVMWRPNSGVVNPGRLEGTDAFVHLAGENIVTGRWNDTKKRRIRSSRVIGTKVIASTLARMERNLRFWFVPRRLVFTATEG
jgi:uncharacterized protein